MKFIFTALVRSVLEYGSVVWSPYQNCSGGSTSECLIRPGPFTLSAVVSTQLIMYITALSRDFTDLETSSPPGMTFAVIVLCT
ncbi:hypothetical protein J6590_052551 [Homalodisca vitripennis]|nr:hypothetical protein J6590_052551 [Homalodisca vitripennis]